jgi:nucleotide-binding universal stress UspA family protein
MEEFTASAREAGVAVTSVAAEGRSYTGILHLAATQRVPLIVLGADGLGAVGNGLLGGTTTRVLASAPCDVLVARGPLGEGPILAGVDGSEQALKAASVAVSLGGAMQRAVRVAAAYDPHFHTQVFLTMARSLSPQRQEEVGLANQEELHDEIINDGLGRLYAEFLNEATKRLGGNGVEVETSLVAGKAYAALDAHAREVEAGLIVVGRHGHHREPYSHLGSNAEGLLRTTRRNVLIVGGSDLTLRPDVRQSAHVTVSEPHAAPPRSDLAWDPEAEARLQRVPSFARSMARRAVETAVREGGHNRVSAADFDRVAAQFGMGRQGGNR